MPKSLFRFGEDFIFHTHGWQWILVLLLLPLSIVYCLICAFRKLFSREIDFGIPIISVGNLTVGGSGKTPVTIAIAKLAKKPAIVLRGYGRKSSGLVVVKDFENTLVDVETSGDEAMEYATMLPHAVVIVCEDRVVGINKAKELGAEVVLLDDGFGKFNIKKYDILLEPKERPRSPFCLPAGSYKCPLFMRDYADLILIEGEHFRRKVSVKNRAESMLLMTSISNPSRLEPFLPAGVIDRLYFKDHDYFDLGIVRDKMATSGAKSLLVTNKDAVKLVDCDIQLSIMRLDIEFDEVVLKTIKSLDGIE